MVKVPSSSAAIAEATAAAKMAGTSNDLKLRMKIPQCINQIKTEKRKTQLRSLAFSVKRAASPTTFMASPRLALSIIAIKLNDLPLRP